MRVTCVQVALSSLAVVHRAISLFAGLSLHHGYASYRLRHANGIISNNNVETVETCVEISQGINLIHLKHLEHRQSVNGANCDLD